MRPESNMALSFDNPFPVFPNRKKITMKESEAASPKQQRPPQANFPGPNEHLPSNRAVTDRNASGAVIQRRHGSDPPVQAFAPHTSNQTQNRHDGMGHTRPSTSGPAQHSSSGASEPHWPIGPQPYPERSQTMPPTMESQQGARKFSRENHAAQRAQGPERFALPFRGRNSPQQPYNGQYAARDHSSYNYAPAEIYQDMSRDTDIEEEMPNFDEDNTAQNQHRRGYSDEQQQRYQAARAPYQNAAEDELYLPQTYNASQRSNQDAGAGRQLNKSRSQPNIRGQAQGGRARIAHEMAENVSSMPIIPHQPRHNPYSESPYQASGGHFAGSQPYHGPSAYRQNSGPSLSRELRGNQEPRNHPHPTPGYAYAGTGYHRSDRHYRASPMQDFSQRSMIDHYPETRQNFAPRPPQRASQETTISTTSSSHTLSDSQTNPDSLPYNPLPSRPTPTAQGSFPSAGRPPVRRYQSDPSSIPVIPSFTPAKRAAPTPVTATELQRLRDIARASPTNSYHQLFFAKKLAEAAVVLVDEGGKADNKTKNKNREKYISESCKIVKKLAHSGYPDAMFYLADCYGSGRLGLGKDSREAFTMYLAAAKSGHANAAYRTAVCCEIGSEQGGGTRKDTVKAMQWYRRAATLGDVPAMYKLGVILLRGLLGQSKNVDEALNWLKKAAENATEENPHALHELAILYSDGGAKDGIPPNDQYALNLFKKAAELHYKYSQLKLGQCYEYGHFGCPIDARCSIAWYSRAAALGEHEAQLSLSGWYLTGSQGILEQSDAEAYLWARKAAVAEPALPKAMYAMGYFHEVGIGCASSLDEAKRWYTRSACKFFIILFLLVNLFQLSNFEFPQPSNFQKRKNGWKISRRAALRRRREGRKFREVIRKRPRRTAPLCKPYTLKCSIRHLEGTLAVLEEFNLFSF